MSNTATAVPAIVVTGEGTSATLSPSTVDLPEPGPDEVRVRVAYAGVNYWDVMQRRAVVPLPANRVPGVEGAGVVVAAGTDTGDWVGRRVTWGRGVPGSYAAEVIAPTSALVEVPDDIDDQQAAAIPMQGTTAEYLAFDTTNLAPGDTALVFAAAGGVGGLLTQMLVSRGVTVTGVVGSGAKIAEAERTGCADVVLDGDDVVSRALAVQPDGYAAVFNANGGAGSVGCLAALRTRGILVLYGAASGPVPDIPAGELSRGSLFVTRTAGASYSRTPQEWAARAAHVLAMMRDGILRPHISRVLPLREAATAHELLESRATTGKLLLDPAG